MSEKVATFDVNLEGNAREVAREDSAALETLREKIRGSSDALKQMGAAYRSLRGKTDEVTVAKTKLQAKINAERDAMSAANLAILDQGTTYERLAERARMLAKAKEKLELKREAERLARLRLETEKLSARSDKMHQGISKAGGPVADLAGKLETLKGIAGGAGGSVGLLTFALAGAVAVLAGLAAAAVGAAVALGRWIIEGANAVRTMGLVREAATGSAESAKNLGDQVDLLAHKVATPRAKLEELAVSMTKTLSRSMVSGQGIVDTFNAVAQASEAMGDDVGKQLGEIITRAKRFGRVQISPFELQGSGPQLQDIAKELATQMHVSVAAAQMALVQGRVKVDDAAKAIRATVEKRFGEINARKLLDLDVQMVKFHEKLLGLTSGVMLDPLLKGLDKITSLFDSSTVAGAALKDMVTEFGNAIVGGFTEKGVPSIQQFVKQLIIAGLKAEIYLLKMKGSILEFVDGFGRFATVKNVVLGMTAVVGGLTAACLMLAVATAEVWVPFFLVGAAVAALVVAIPTLIKAWDSLNEWAKGAAKSMEDLGASLVAGFLKGIDKTGDFLVEKVKGLADSVKKAFKGALGISSPSKVFALYGQQTAEGAAEGMESGAPAVQAAADAMAPTPAAGRGGAGGGPGSGVVVNLNVSINVAGGGSGKENAQALSDPSFLGLLTKAIEDALSGAGIPTQGGAPA